MPSAFMARSQTQELERLCPLQGFVSSLLDQYQQTQLLTWHDDGIPYDEIWLKIEGDHSGNSFKLSLQVLNVQNPNAKDSAFLTCLVQEQKLVLVSWVDLQKAFDKVWMEGLLVKLLRNGIASNIFNWIKSYLYNRRARVSVDRIHNKKILLRHGVPQGGVLSPTLFLLFINDLVSELPKGVKAALYADDLVIWCKEEYATTATYRMQLAADKLNSWTEKWCVAVNKDKSFHHLVHPVPKGKSRHHHSWWDPAEGG